MGPGNVFILLAAASLEATEVCNPGHDYEFVINNEYKTEVILTKPDPEFDLKKNEAEVKKKKSEAQAQASILFVTHQKWNPSPSKQKRANSFLLVPRKCLSNKFLIPRTGEEKTIEEIAETKSSPKIQLYTNWWQSIKETPETTKKCNDFFIDNFPKMFKKPPIMPQKVQNFLKYDHITYSEKADLVFNYFVRCGNVEKK